MIFWKISDAASQDGRSSRSIEIMSGRKTLVFLQNEAKSWLAIQRHADQRGGWYHDWLSQEKKTTKSWLAHYVKFFYLFIHFFSNNDLTWIDTYVKNSRTFKKKSLTIRRIYVYCTRKERKILFLYSDEGKRTKELAQDCTKTPAHPFFGT